MMDKLFFFRSLAAASLICLLFWVIIRLLTNRGSELPEGHKEILLGSFLLWFMGVLSKQNSNDDDWAGDV